LNDVTVEGVLGPGGALAAALPGYEHRAAQVEVAVAVADALSCGHALLAEAGTGTGKTLAYLVPAVLSGKRVIVSTATRNLQDQVFQKDIPLLRTRVGLAFDAALLKGRSNYLCVLRFDSFSADPLFASAADAAFWPGFREWARNTESGDRAESGIPDAWSAWTQVSTTPDSCLGGKCPRFEGCYVTRARSRAQEAEVVVVNHALFFADLSLRLRGGDRDLRILPHADAVVFDEAHTLEDVATEFFGVALSSMKLQALAHDSLSALEVRDVRAAALAALAVQLKTHAAAFFGEAASELGLSTGGEARLRPDLLVHSRPLASALQQTLEALAALCSEEDPDLGSLHRRAGEAAASLEHVLSAQDPNQVYWAQARGRGLLLRAAPIDVGATLAAHLYSSVETVIFTSATLTASVDGSAPSFDYLVERLGLSGRAWKALRVESPFDYPTQAGLYVPRHLPEPNHPEWSRAFAREVFQLVRLTGGRAFVLFTSHRHLDEVHALVAPHLDVPALKQGDAPRAALLDAFQTRPSVLFASQSFWEGVDVPGDALSLVIIDRLPFAPPGDPLQAARMEALRLRGQEPFRALQLPQAALSLRQGFGRLIRTRSDRGVVALGDVRIVTKRYGRALLESLPPAQILLGMEDVKAFWARLRPDGF
jgi:ATP-dependent DNA helicase DinG